MTGRAPVGTVGRRTAAGPRIGGRSWRTRFAPHELPGLPGHRNVKNCDGSWMEYGSLLGAPIEAGS